MKLVIVDDDPFVCLSLQTILSAQEDITVAATGADGNEAIDLYHTQKPDILLMDIQMQPLGGLAAAEAILQEDPAARILFLTTFSDDEYLREALRIGAKGYLIKQETESIAPALRAVMNGQSVFGGQMAQKLSHLAPPVPSDPPLSLREMQVLHEVAQGRNNREIAQALYLSEGTVRNYISIILDKLGVRDRTQLVVYYYQNLARKDMKS